MLVAVTANSSKAFRGTDIGVVSITVVALLTRFRVHAAIAAALDKTSRRTVITTDQVAIVAFLALARDPIAATSRGTGVRAVIGIDAVGVIAALTGVDASVTTDFRIAVLRAAVAADVIGVVAFFITAVNKAVAAGS